ncbi:Protein mono-ADP-ribosyltransferase PARP12 (ADP-ribosyltransferase diphtheria toxin-like 12) (ARTD12) (Poly [ADP-ribose] polymerase 12) (PARP-12) (Zinc finger CCCH domain-containing protein 1) [Durusdinium trenchii]|uniref:Poly [ADP-ribose] polymerase n=1 Tax=Durusdinium trenchii TaxID=1381693 RepID=A0ABP0L570_9DINO
MPWWGPVAVELPVTERSRGSDESYATGGSRGVSDVSIDESDRPAKAAKLTESPAILPQIILEVPGCNVTESDKIQGTYRPVSTCHHDKPVYKKLGPDTTNSYIYFSKRGGGACCWWFGPEVGGDEVWAFNAGCDMDNPLAPPAVGWRATHDGSVDDRLQIMTIGGGHSRISSSSNCEETCQTLQQALSVERKERERLELALQEEVRKVAAAKVTKRFWKDRRKAERERRDLVEDALAQAQETLRDFENLLAAEREKVQVAEKKIEEMQDQYSARLEGQKQISRMDGNRGACWQYEERGGWHAVTPEGNDQMHQAYLSYLRDPTCHNRFATISVAGVDRQVDYELMTQKRCGTNKVRRIRILPGVPKQWLTTAACLLQQTDQLQSFYVNITDDSYIHDKVREVLQFTGHGQDGSQQCSCMKTATVKSVHRIENWKLWQAYKLRRQILRMGHSSQGVWVTPVPLDLDAFDAGCGVSTIMTNNQGVFDCGETLALDIDEKILLHGTSWDCVNSIVCSGFDHRTCHRGMYGDGVYFASAACKSHQYTCKDHKYACDCKCERALIIARVALGDAYYAKETRYKERRPPVRNSKCGVTYDSIVVNPGPINGHHNAAQVHQEFVICQMEQAYPCYVVKYQV